MMSLLRALLLVTAAAAFLPSAPTRFRRMSTRVAAEVTLDGETIRGPITPLGNYVLVLTKDTLSATSGGILLPDEVRSVCEVYELVY